MELPVCFTAPCSHPHKPERRAHSDHSVICLPSVLFFFFFQAAVKSMQHTSRSLCTFICIPAVCPSLHSANARLLIMFQNPKAFGKALITPKAHKTLFDLFFSYVTFSIALFFCSIPPSATMMYSVKKLGLGG